MYMTKMARMKSRSNDASTDGLLLKDVVERAELDRRTARYVLDKASQLQIHEVDRGYHRRFSMAEAVRLAVCTRLVMFGVRLESAAWATMHCEKQVNLLTRPRPAPDALPFDSHRDDPWRLRMVNGKYIQVWREKLEEMNARSYTIDEDEYYPIGGGRKVRLSVMRHLPVIEWNLRDLAIVLYSGYDEGIEQPDAND
jgi:hypothetical protein